MLFQDSATPIMEGITNLHHDLMFFITFILFFVLVILIRTLFYFKQKSLLIGNNSYTLSRSIVHGTTIEIIWTVIPSLILIVVALPSFALLYSIDEVVDPSLTVKCIGNQWYWSYEYSDFENSIGNITFDSYMVIFLGHKEPLTESQLLSNNLYVNFEEAYTCNFLVFKIAANMGQRE